MVLLFFLIVTINAHAQKLEEIHIIEISKKRSFWVNGKPFFPIMIWLQDTKNFDKIKNTGVNTIVGYWPGAGGTKDVVEYQAKVGENGFYGVMPFDTRLKGNPYLLAYIHGDEPDLPYRPSTLAKLPKLKKVPRKWPDEIMKEYQQIKTADKTRPVFLTMTGYFLPHFGKWDDKQRENLYKGYIKAADVVGFNIYPIYGWNKTEWLHLVNDGTKELMRLADYKPIYAWIETSKGGKWTGNLEKQKPVTPMHIRAEVWMAICQGATAIGYFTHVWKPSYNQFGLPQKNITALQDINNQISRLSEAILAPEAKVKTDITLGKDNIKAAIKATEYNGSLFLFTVNYDSKQQGGKATIIINGLKGGTPVEVLDENRVIISETDQFHDLYGPLGVHIYKLRL